MNFSEVNNLTTEIPHGITSETNDLETTLDQTLLPHHKSSLNFGQIILITLAVLASICLLGFLALKFYKQRKSNRQNLNNITSEQSDEDEDKERIDDCKPPDDP